MREFQYYLLQNPSQCTLLWAAVADPPMGKVSRRRQDCPVPKLPDVVGVSPWHECQSAAQASPFDAGAGAVPQFRAQRGNWRSAPANLRPYSQTHISLYGSGSGDPWGVPHLGPKKKTISKPPVSLASVKQISQDFFPFWAVRKS